MGNRCIEQSWPPSFTKVALVAQADIIPSSEPQNPELGRPAGEFSEFSTILKENRVWLKQSEFY